MSETEKQNSPEMQKPRCTRCQTEENVRYYVIANDLENPRPYCTNCRNEIVEQIMIEWFIKKI